MIFLLKLIFLKPFTCLDSLISEKTLREDGRKEKHSNLMNEVMDDREFVRLIEENKNRMYRLALSIVKNEFDAEDVMSDTVIKAYENKGTIRDATRFKAWIMTILSNEAKTLLRKRSRVVLTDDLEPTGVSQDMQNEKDHELWDIVMNMDEKYSKIVVLYYYLRFSVKEIGKILHLSQGAVKTRLSRAREELRKELKL